MPIQHSLHSISHLEENRLITLSKEMVIFIIMVIFISYFW